MKYLRFMSPSGETAFGVLDGERVIRLTGDFLDGSDRTNESFSLDEIRILAPTTPSKIIAVGLNYYDHIKEFGDRDVPAEPTLFCKLPHTVIGMNDAIISHPFSQRIDFEGELALIIGKHCKDVKAEDAHEYIFGVTCLNDVTARDLQRADGQWTRGKNLETFCPVGPFVATGVNYDDLALTSRLNGKTMQESRTSLMIHSPAKLVEYISQAFPLEKGDIISTGTPKGVAPMVRGDVIEIEIEGVGTLVNIMK